MIVKVVSLTSGFVIINSFLIIRWSQVGSAEYVYVVKLAVRAFIGAVVHVDDSLTILSS